MALVKTIFSKQNHLIKQTIGNICIHPPALGASYKKSAMFLHL